jgi:hypothetical protein
VAAARARRCVLKRFFMEYLFRKREEMKESWLTKSTA